MAKCLVRVVVGFFEDEPLPFKSEARGDQLWDVNFGTAHEWAPREDTLLVNHRHFQLSSGASQHIILVLQSKVKGNKNSMNEY